MRILFIGGTRFVGQAMAREALARGHHVDLFHRGKTEGHGLEGARTLLGDRVTDLGALAQGEWDAVIDTCAFRPRDVHLLADAIQARAPRHVFVSSVSVYDPQIPADADETAALASTAALDRSRLDTLAIDGDTYGPMKVLCEEAVAQRRPGALVLRPTYVVGPNDYTQRFPQWVRRIAAGGEVEAPGPAGAAVQYVDARDLAAFTIAALEQGVTGTFNVASPRVPFSFRDLLEGVVRGVAPAGTSLRWLGVEEATPRAAEFPLWHGGADYGLAAVNSDAARRHGFAPRPLEETARDVLAWAQAGR